MISLKEGAFFEPGDDTVHTGAIRFDREIGKCAEAASESGPAGRSYGFSADSQ